MDSLTGKQRIVNYCDRIIEISLYVLIFCLPFSKAIIEISATCIILSWFLKRAFSYRPSPAKVGLIERIKAFNPVSTYLDIPIIVYCLAMFLAVIFSSNFPLSLKNFGSKTMEYILLYFIFVELFANKKILKNAIIITLVAALMIGLDCIFQYFFGFDLLRLWPLQAHRITGSFQMPGDLAGYLGTPLCLALSLGFLKIKRTRRYFLWSELILLLILFIATLTRGAWLGFIIALCFLGALEDKKILFATIALSLISGVLMPHLLKTPHGILTHLRSITAVSDFSRLDREMIWAAALEMIEDKPIFGLGLSAFMGNFTRYAGNYPLLKYGIIPYAHNCYLQLAAETGIVGLVSFLSLLGTFLVKTVISLRRLKDKFYHAVLSGVSAGIIVTLVHSFVDTNLYSLQLSVLFWLMLALNAALQRDLVCKKVNI